MNQKADKRVAMSINCVWWDMMNNAGTHECGLPCCPHCNSMLIEVTDMKQWNNEVKEFADLQRDAEYPKFIKWLQGKCYPDYVMAREVYRKEIKNSMEVVK